MLCNWHVGVLDVAVPGHRLSHSVIMSLPETRLAQNSVELRVLGNLRTTPQMMQWDSRVHSSHCDAVLAFLNLDLEHHYSLLCWHKPSIAVTKRVQPMHCYDSTAQINEKTRNSWRTIYPASTSGQLEHSTDL